ncbi:hypothetical protein B0H66DRAFT_570397 [Apodospora peruviana]|uniref:Secreted protein n=1 Tax=Apodospora peruviana TaxID=516989 RepID=A0AAE0LYD8_9PEZI|nr:hypothetical protein B0H66DRAFT_570397 [Apodospora peruviana]
MKCFHLVTCLPSFYLLPLQSIWCVPHPIAKICLLPFRQQLTFNPFFSVWRLSSHSPEQLSSKEIFPSRSRPSTTFLPRFYFFFRVLEVEYHKHCNKSLQ